ncbi:MAG: Crp/Fnr family transcriptional regulator [Sphingomonadaceae bacterium]
MAYAKQIYHRPICDCSEELQPDLATALELRLQTLVRLSDVDLTQVRDCAARTHRSIEADEQLVSEGELLRKPIAILSGWGAKVRVLLDGRRQLLSLLLPGDLVWGRTSQSTSSSNVVALTPMTVCEAPQMAELARNSALRVGYAAAAELEEYHMLSQITRLGRLTAYERCADFLLEIGERLSLAGLTDGNCFSLPLTQDCLADALGLTTVHINRTLQSLRRDGVIRTKRGSVTLLNPVALAKLVDRRLAPRLRRPTAQTAASAKKASAPLAQ